MIPRARAAAVLLAAILTACAPGTSPVREGPALRTAQAAGYALDRVDTPPRLIGCSAYTEPLASAGGSWVQFEFVVGTEGRVQPGTIRQTGTYRARAGDAAREALLTCAYEPGIHEGQPVAVRMRRAFHVS